MYIYIVVCSNKPPSIQPGALCVNVEDSARAMVEASSMHFANLQIEKPASNQRLYVYIYIYFYKLYIHT